MALNGYLIGGSINLRPGSAPSNPVEGDVYYDETDNLLKYYDGSVFKNVGNTDYFNLVRSFRTVTGTDDIELTDDIILADCTGAGVNLNLPAASTSEGQQFEIRKIDVTTNDVVISADGSDVILDNSATGVATVQLNTCTETMIIACDGTDWHVLNRRTPSFRTVDADYDASVAGETVSPTFGASTDGTMTAIRTSDGIRMIVKIVQTNAGTAGTDRYFFPLPPGLAIDNSTGPLGPFVGTAIVISGGVTYMGSCKIIDANNLALTVGNSSTAFTDVGSAFLPVSVADTQYYFDVVLPIVDFET